MNELLILMGLFIYFNYFKLSLEQINQQPNVLPYPIGNDFDVVFNIKISWYTQSETQIFLKKDILYIYIYIISDLD